MSEHANTLSLGAYITSLLAKRKWSQRILSAVTQIDRAVINKIIQGKRSIDASTALVLAEAFQGCCTAEDFLRVQSEYELAQAREKYIPNTSRTEIIRLFGQAPLLAMGRRKWIDLDGTLDDVKQLEEELQKFYCVSSVEEIGKMPFSAKRTATEDSYSSLQIAWVSRAKQIARTMNAPSYSQTRLRDALKELRKLMINPSGAGSVPEVLNSCGVRFLAVEGLKSSKIDGACFWIDDAPVICVSLRYDRIDNFWYVLIHEIGHVLHNHSKQGGIMLDVDLGSSEIIHENEKIADAVYSRFVDPNGVISEFIDSTRYFSESRLIDLSESLQLHPGIVAGQIQFKTKNYTRFRKHLVKIRDQILPHITSDGWGTVWTPQSHLTH